MRFGVVM